MDGREWYDIALIALIACFVMLKATLLDKHSRLGWAMTITNVVWFFAYARLLFQPIIFSNEPPWALYVMRILIAASVGWCIVELILARWIFVRLPSGQTERDRGRRF
jgi:hypothetical protein